uniref:Arb2 domain-containing protein n=1 Tax=Steinernema glaseri TaxID=37863 RepID=A0A1I8ALD2_9BILA
MTDRPSEHEKERSDLTSELRELGYVLNAEGALVSTEDEEKFKYTNEENYDKVGSILLNLMYNELTDPEGDYMFQRHKVDGADVNYFASADYRTSETVVFLVHGSGKIRAGQWARSLMINESTDNGSMMPMIRHFQKQKYGIVLFDYNERTEDEWSPIKGSHATWQHLMKDDHLKAKSIVIVAHSFGGGVIYEILKEYDVDEDQMPPIKAIAYTDVGFAARPTLDLLKHWNDKPAFCHWMASGKELDEVINPYTVSAGTKEHIRTTLQATESIFKFVEEALKE